MIYVWDIKTVKNTALLVSYMTSVVLKGVFKIEAQNVKTESAENLFHQRHHSGIEKSSLLD
jgi:hypothetical protein